MTDEIKPPFDLASLIQPDAWITPNSYRYHPRELWFPLSTAVDVWDTAFHELMLHDRLRMSAFSAAIQAAAINLIHRYSAKKETVRILDIGTGTGILAYMFSLQLKDIIPPNKLRIFALEANPQIFSRMTLPCLGITGGRSEPQMAPDQPILACRAVGSDLHEYVLSNKKIIKRFDSGLLKSFSRGETKVFDAIICECIGGIGDDEGITEIMGMATERFARPNCILIPDKIEIWAAPVWEDPHAPLSFYARLQTFRDQGETSEIIRSIPQHEPKDLLDEATPFLDTIIPDDSLASPPQRIHALDFHRGPSNGSYKVQCSFLPDRTGVPEKYRVTGFKLYFKARLFSADGEMGRGLEERKSGTAVGGNAVWLDISGDKISPFGEDISHLASDCWKHTLVPIATPLNVATGDNLIFSFERKVQGIPPRESTEADGSEGAELVYSWSARIKNKPNKVHKYDGCYSFCHKILAGMQTNTDALQWNLYDLYRTLGLVSDVVISLCISVLFALLIGVHNIAELEWYQKLALGGIGLQLIRIVHSFMVLTADHRFARLEYDEFISHSKLEKFVIIFTRIFLAVVVTGFVLSILHPSLSEWIRIPWLVSNSLQSILIFIAIMPTVMFAALYLWDRATLKVVESKVEKSIYVDPWWAILKNTAESWVRGDRIAFRTLVGSLLGFGVLFVMTYAKLRLFSLNFMPDCVTSDRVITAAVVIGEVVLAASFVWDYSKNANFYSARMKDAQFDMANGASRDHQHHRPIL